MKLIFFIILLTLFLNGCDNSQVLYHCPDEYSSQSCSNECKKVENTKYEFILNKEKSNVMLKVYYKDKFQMSFIFDNCQFFDEKNWDCSDKEYGVLGRNVVKKIDGQIRMYNESLGNQDKHDSGGVCTK